MPRSNSLDFLTDHIENFLALFIRGRYQSLIENVSPNSIKFYLRIIPCRNLSPSLFLRINASLQYLCDALKIPNHNTAFPCRAPVRLFIKRNSFYGLSFSCWSETQQWFQDRCFY